MAQPDPETMVCDETRIEDVLFKRSVVFKISERGFGLPIVQPRRRALGDRNPVQYNSGAARAFKAFRVHVVRVTIAPSGFVAQSIGHLDAYARQSSALWPQLIVI